MIPLLLYAQVVSAQSTSLPDQFGSGSNAFAIDFVRVGNARNAPDGWFGSVPYSYRIGKYEISQDVVDKARAAGLQYVTAGAWTGNQPAANISWYEAAAFVNWLNTSKGHQAAYNLIVTNGIWLMQVWSTTNAWTLGGTNLYRHKSARYFLPSDNEWYKAAYYNPAQANYFIYPTGIYPNPVVSGTNTGTAVYDLVARVPAAVNNAGGLSAYGTMGQGGNVSEWNETADDGTNDSAPEARAHRGGSWVSSQDRLRTTGRLTADPLVKHSTVGFRVASVPENLYESFGLAAAAARSPFDTAPVSNWAADGTEWTVDIEVSHDGFDSVKAQTTDGQSTYREYTVTGPAVVDFWWRVSSEELYDTFSWSVNAVNQQTISGEVDWTYRTLTLPAGTHTIRWTYTKDESGAVGQDAGWLDDFVVYPATATLQVRDGSTVLDDEATVDFGSADTGSTGFTKSLTFANEGYVPLEVQLSLPEGSPFAFDDGAATYELLLGRGEIVDVPIVLSTARAGTMTEKLQLQLPGIPALPGKQPTSVTLTGYVRGPDIGLTQGATALASGQTFDMGLAPRTVEFTIRNNGNVGDLVIAGISATGNFQITQQPATTIPPQTSTTFKVLAQNVVNLLQAGSVSITSNAGNLETFSLTLTSKSLISVEGIADGSMATSGTGGATAWDFAATTLPSGQSGQALKTGTTPNNGGSVLEFTTQTAGVVSWSWKVSTQENFDWLLFEVDGQEAAGISTKNSVWQTQVVNVPAGANVRWVYRKDASGNIGEDAGYLADVEFRSFAANQSFSQWGQTHGIYDPQQQLNPYPVRAPLLFHVRPPRRGLKAMFAWLGGFDPDVGTSSLDLHHDVFLQPDGMFLSLLLYRFSISKTADGTQQILYSSDMSSWTTRRISQRIVSEDADRVVIEATAPSGTKGFFKVVGSGDTSMVWVEGGTLPQTSGLAGTAVETFQIGRTEVTWSEWQEVRDWAVANGYTDLAGIGSGSGPEHPVRSVNWYDVVKWCNAKSEKDGLAPVYQVHGAVYRTGEVEPAVTSGANGYRLPTEAEWEWAARGGASSQGYIYSGSDDVNVVAWYSGNSSDGTKVVGTKAANELGIHDMSGNLWEWCSDGHPILGKSIRGGAYYLGATDLVIDFSAYVPDIERETANIGFRLVRQAILENRGDKSRP